MTKAPVFSNILDRPMNLTERPRPMPVGQYNWVIQGLPLQDASFQKQTPFVEFTCRCLGPVSDQTVDQDALLEWLTNVDGSKKKIEDVIQKLRFFATESALWRLKKFLEHLGFDPNTNASLKQVIAGTPGCQFIGTIKHRSSEDGESAFAYIDSTAPATE